MNQYSDTTFIIQIYLLLDLKLRTDDDWLFLILNAIRRISILRVWNDLHSPLIVFVRIFMKLMQRRRRCNERNCNTRISTALHNLRAIAYVYTRTFVKGGLCEPTSSRKSHIAYDVWWVEARRFATKMRPSDIKKKPRERNSDYIWMAASRLLKTAEVPQRFPHALRTRRN